MPISLRHSVRSIALLIAGALMLGQVRAQSEPAGACLGINLSGPADWNTELPFVDVFRFSRAWISQREGAAWGSGPKLDLDQDGWVRRLEPDCFAETPLCTIEGGHYPSGEWTVLWQGDGKLELSKGNIVATSPGRLVAHIDSQGGGFFLRLRATDPNNPVRNIRVLMPGVSEEQSASNPWNPTFLQRWRGIACVRFMDFQLTNDSQQEQWQDRPTLRDATWTRRGVPVEVMCDLANRLQADAWFCMPHRASDDYVRQFAKLVRASLAPGRRAWIEYSNEVWNAQFEQHRYAAEQGREQGLADKPWEAAWRFTARRSVQIFSIWEQEFQAADRLVRVLPSQAANSYIAEQIAQFDEAGQRADVLAIAPYISMNIPSAGEGLTADQVAQWSVDQFLDHVTEQALPESIRWMEDNRKTADRYGLKLVCYEAGQHFVGIGDAVNNDQLTRLLHAANRHPRMAEIYEKYYASWEASGGDLLCHFSSVSQWSKWGSWGLLEYADQPADTSPKFKATMSWGRQLGQPARQ